MIRSISTKFIIIAATERVFALSEELQSSFIVPLPAAFRQGTPSRLSCVVREISIVTTQYRAFILGKSGDGRRTKALRTGITELERLRDNWNNVEVIGDFRHGYRLELKV